MTTEATIEKKSCNHGVETTRSGRYYRPSVDILELPEKLVVVSDVPGVVSSEIDIHFEDGQLTV